MLAKWARPVFTPASVFAGGAKGLWLETIAPASNVAPNITEYQDSALTSPVTAIAQTVGGWKDKSGQVNNLLQATGANQPTLSARVNLLTKTEQLDDAAWTKRGTCAITANATTAPDGTQGADLVSGLGVAGTNDLFNAGGTGTTSGSSLTPSFYIQKVSATGMLMLQNQQSPGFGLWTIDFSKLGTGWEKITATHPAVTVTNAYRANGNADGPLFGTTTGPLSFYLWGFDLRYTSDTTKGYPAYQRVNTSSDYDTAGFPFYLAFNGTNSLLQTATFAAGTLTASMDVFVLMKRTNANAGTVAASGAAGSYIGAFASGGAGTTTSGAGAGYAVLVNGSAVADTAGALHTALPVGGWCLLEYQNVDLSAWTAFGLSNFGAGQFVAGEEPCVIVCPAGSAAQRASLRHYLGSKVGLPL